MRKRKRVRERKIWLLTKECRNENYACEGGGMHFDQTLSILVKSFHSLTHSLCLSPTLTFTLSFSPFLTHSLSHSHTHTLTHSRTLSLIVSLSFSLSFSFSFSLSPSLFQARWHHSSNSLEIQLGLLNPSPLTLLSLLLLPKIFDYSWVSGEYLVPRKFPMLFAIDVFHHFALRILSLQIKSQFFLESCHFGHLSLPSWRNKFAHKKSPNNEGRTYFSKLTYLGVFFITYEFWKKNCLLYILVLIFAYLLRPIWDLFNWMQKSLLFV